MRGPRDRADHDVDEFVAIGESSLDAPAMTSRRRSCSDRSTTPTPSQSFPLRTSERERAFYRGKLGLEPVEERMGGLRYRCGPTEFHLFSSAGQPSGASTQMAFEVENLEVVLADLRVRGVTFERFEMPGVEVSGDVITVPNNYPSKGTASSARSSKTAKAT
jgi:hypothetical protein